MEINRNNLLDRQSEIPGLFERPGCIFLLGLFVPLIGLIVALKAYRRDPGRKGQGLIKATIIIGAIWLTLLVTGIVFHERFEDRARSEKYNSEQKAIEVLRHIKKAQDNHMEKHGRYGTFRELGLRRELGLLFHDEKVVYNHYFLMDRYITDDNWMCVIVHDSKGAIPVAINPEGKFFYNEKEDGSGRWYPFTPRKLQESSK